MSCDETGGEIAYNMRETEQAFTVGGTNVPLPSASVKVEETRGELFSKGTWRLHPDLTLEGGLRLEASTISQSGDADQEKSFFFAKPRLLATWTPMPNNQLRFRFERELGQLDFSDFAASADLEEENVFGGNVDLEPEQRWISELTYERRFWGEGVLSLGYRHDEIVDAIDVIPLADDLSATGNIGDGSLDQLAATHPDAETKSFTTAVAQRLDDLGTAITASESMPPARRRAAHQAIARELDGIDADLLNRLGVSS